MSKPIYFSIKGNYGLFTDPLTMNSGQKFSYQIPTYAALVGIAEKIYWKPTFNWVIDCIRVMNPIQMETIGTVPRKFRASGVCPSAYTYLTDCWYLVKAHFEWNMNKPEYANDRNEYKHESIMERSLKKGGRFNAFIGTSECMAMIEPITEQDFNGKMKGYYDTAGDLYFGNMYYSISYPYGIHVTRTDGITVNYWHNAYMHDGMIEYPRPWDTSKITPGNSFKIKRQAVTENVG